ncbi:MAG TPA: 5-amino-6-(D-ribitylamino)uracil--L-tyrosine 4-hydroxyphenyl transferase CofH [Steroidobacter sp.]|uniref:5-amino-6-(D-ribitylamino)uracil--L-tyrosine 4-hydroxyphenyl transferase CofH n=1 Tax=Steroidobacter sp. TaxID=1978227 RepID=UPI002ED8C8A0
MTLATVLRHAVSGRRVSDPDALALADEGDVAALLHGAEQIARNGFGLRMTYSRKVFIPLTQLCRDVCHYCTFAQPPRKGARAYLSIDEVVEIARKGAAAGCKEALFTLGDKPELRYRGARAELDELGFASTLDYLEAAARAVFEQTGLLPHLNPGVMSAAELARLRGVSVSMGVMLESASERLCGKGMPHARSPDKIPARRIETLRAAGELSIPITTGLLIGIGETRLERIESLLAIRSLAEQYGHIQEVIIQNFRAKAGTRMARHAEPELQDYLWTIAVARLVLGESMSIQAPPNLSPDALGSLLAAGINDWGGVSPVTPDHVNPEAPWPELVRLEQQTALSGRVLTERLALVPRFASSLERWVAPPLQASVRRLCDATGHARDDGWCAGEGSEPPSSCVTLMNSDVHAAPAAGSLGPVLDKAQRGVALAESEIVELFSAAGPQFTAVVCAANDLRAQVIGDAVSYVVNRNINYTNICTYSCGFCAFAKGRSARALRGPAYDLSLDEIRQRVVEAWNKGASEVCLQGGIHPRFTGETYVDIVAAVKDVVPEMHVHAFSPLEITHGAQTLGVALEDYLLRLKAAGLSTLPGTAAEILDDDVRRLICPDKLTTTQWLDVMRTAHKVGLKSTATIMFGHVDSPRHWARHLLRIRELQEETGGFTEFVPLPFVHMEAPLARRGMARSGPTFRESVLMHAIARLVLHPLVPNIQTSWVKMGVAGAMLCLDAGANDLGGTLMNESITRAAGGVNGQEQDAASLEARILQHGRRPRRRTTLYADLGVVPRILEPDGVVLTS